LNPRPVGYEPTELTGLLYPALTRDTNVSREYRI
jgi:hypothetical protein